MRFFLLFFILFSKISYAQNISGAWKNTTDTTQTLILANENYVSITEYSTVGNRFIQAWGGKYEISKTEEIFIDIAFHSKKAQLVGTNMSFNINQKKKNLSFTEKTFDRIGNSKADALTGLWKISWILRKGEMTEMPKGPRKTLKIMAGGYFQWFAINNVTSEFFGTGGGLYTIDGKKYTEELVFFSRDNTRVGSKLSFDAAVSDKSWTHSGQSSKGEPLKEIWEKQ
jgi:hypothetical protein